MSEWQDISTAPKDGRDLLMFIPGRPMSVAGWNRHAEEWQDYDGVCVREVFEGFGPTHWMPLPQPPVVS